MGKPAVIDVASDPFRRSGTLPKWAPPSVTGIQRWVQRLPENGDTLLTVLGPSPMLRAEAFRVCYAVPGLEVVGNGRSTQDWFGKGLANDVSQRVRALTGRPWGLVWDLIEVEDFVVEEPLRSLIDQGLCLTGLFKALWECRLLRQEGQEERCLELMGAVLRWLCAVDLSPDQQRLLEQVRIERVLGTLQERLDVMLFLLALANQNGLADRTVFVFDGVERAVRAGVDKRRDLLRQLYETATTFGRWGRLGSGAGMVLGMDPTALETLGQYHDRLGALMAKALV